VFILINGAFGIGKSTVARELQRLLPGAAVFDPEWIGFVLMRLPGYALSDYQHLAAWRRLSVLGARLFGAAREFVIVPMAFSEVAYLQEVRSGLASSKHSVIHFCLTAPIEVVQARLAARGEPLHDPRWTWVHRRAAECCRAHKSPQFAIHVPTADSSPEAIAAELVQRIRGAT
jgi:predicted kinase